MLNDVLYNLGGYQSKNSVHWLELENKEREWKARVTLGKIDFRDYCFRDATVVGKQVIFFGQNKG